MTRSNTTDRATVSPANSDAPGAATTSTSFIGTAAQAALAHLRQAEDALPLTPGLGEKARKSAMRMQMLPSDLMAEAGTFLAKNGAYYPFLDGDAIQRAAELEQWLEQVVTAASNLVSRARSTVLEQRGPAMEQALALYATLKAQSRKDATVRDAVTRMEPLVNTRKAPHQRKQQRLEGKAKRVAALTAELEREGEGAEEPPAAGAKGTSSVPSSVATS